MHKKVQAVLLILLRYYRKIYIRGSDIMFNNVKLKELRKNAGFTQVQVAEKIGVARTTYAEYEQGKIQPPIDKVQKLSSTFGISTSELLITENNTGIDVSQVHFKNKMSDADKVVIISELQKKKELLHALTDMCLTIQDMDFEEKGMLLPILTYLRNKYTLTDRDMDIEKRIKGKEFNND